MFTSLSLRNIGPLASLDAAVSPTGATTLAGPSGSGKSTLAPALAALLWGDPLNVGDGSPSFATSVGGTSKSGTQLERTKDGYAVQKATDGEATNYRQYTPYALAVGPYATRAEAGRFILCPHAADGFYPRDRGRAFRDALTSALQVDVGAVVRDLMGDDYHPDDPPYLAGRGGALEQATDANRQQATTAGALAAAKDGHARAVDTRARIVTPPDTAVADATATLEASEEWAEYDGLCQVAERATALSDARNDACLRFDAQVEALGVRPSGDDLQAARDVEFAASFDVTTATNAVTAAERVRAQSEALDRGRIVSENMAILRREADDRAAAAQPRADGLPQRDGEVSADDPEWEPILLPNHSIIGVPEGVCPACGQSIP